MKVFEWIGRIVVATIILAIGMFLLYCQTDSRIPLELDILAWKKASLLGVMFVNVIVVVPSTVFSILAVLKLTEEKTGAKTISDNTPT